MSAIVEFRDISKTYDGVHRAVQNLNLGVQRGEFLTLLGPSGSGKTTSLMMLAGFEAPTSGEIVLDGKAVSKMPPYKRDVGVVFQNYALFPHMTVEENIAFPLQVRKLPKDEVKRRVAQALDMVRLSGFGTRQPTEVSGGQQQRVALARALVFQPKIVVMDEPLGALDRQLREEMQLEIRSIHEKLSVTVVYVTHDQEEALTMSDRIAVFNDGVVEQLDKPARLYEAPENVFVARFIGENNLLEGVVKALSGESCSVEVPGLGPVAARCGDIRSEQSDAVVTIRPGKIRVNWDGVAGAGGNSFRATLQEVIYLGDYTKLFVRLAGGQTLLIKMQTDRLDHSKENGQELVVSWDEKDCIAFLSEAERKADRT